MTFIAISIGIKVPLVLLFEQFPLYLEIIVLKTTAKMRQNLVPLSNDYIAPI